MMENGRPILAVSDLSVSFSQGKGWRSVVRGLNFQVDRGETLAIVGESGSGKSVTALSILGLLAEDSSRTAGSIMLGGRELLSLSRQEMKAVRGNEVAMIFQEPMTSLNPSMTIGVQIAEAISVHRNLDRRACTTEAIHLMERVKIPSAQRRFSEYPHQFSGGMRQRIMIAIALACKPALLIADEPTTALDVTIQAEVLNLIKEIQAEENTAILFITHDMGVVAEVSDRTMVLYRGDEIETGATSKVFASPRHPYTRALLSAVPQLGSMKDALHPRPFPIYNTDTGDLGEATELPNTVEQSSSNLLEVEGLTMRFDVDRTVFGRVTARVHAVEDVNFSLSRGETLAIVGESGSGKSTTGKLITGLMLPTLGEVRINGMRMGPDTRRQLSREVQMVFQDPFASLNPRLNIASAIAEPLHIHQLGSASEIREITADLLERVGLSPDVASRYPHEFSGGQRQRICIARALALRPDLIVADEAVSALDVTVKAQIVNLLLELQQELKLGFVFVSHDMAVVERISHRVAVMYLGEIVEIGPRAEVFNNPAHPYTRRLIDAVPAPDPTRRTLAKILSNTKAGSAFRPGNYEHPKRKFREVSVGHFVQVHDVQDWAT